MNNHTQQFAALQQCVHNFPSLSTLVRYMSSLLGRKNVHSVFPEGTLFVHCNRKLLLSSRGATKFKFSHFFLDTCILYMCILSDLPVNNRQNNEKHLRCNASV